MENISWSNKMAGYTDKPKTTALIDRDIKPKEILDTFIILKDIIEKCDIIEANIDELYSNMAHKDLYDAHISISLLKKSLNKLSKN